MPRAKSESLVEKTKKKAKKIVKDVSKEIETTKEIVKEEIQEITKELTGEEKTTKEKKEKKKTEKSKEDTEKEEKLAKLKEKAKKLESAIEEKEIESLKKEKPEEKELLVPIEDYLKSSIHLGTRAITPDMKPYVYKRRADSLAIFNTTLLDQKIRECGEFLSKYSPDDVIVVAKRDAAAKAAAMFSKVTGIKAFIKKYPPGILTNSRLSNFMERELMLICDPWTDKVAMEDAKRIKVPVMAICDTNNYTQGVSVVIPGNNKSAKSLGMIFYLLAKLYVEKRKISVEVPPISEWIENWDTLTPPK